MRHRLPLNRKKVRVDSGAEQDRIRRIVEEGEEIESGDEVLRTREMSGGDRPGAGEIEFGVDFIVESGRAEGSEDRKDSEDGDVGRTGGEGVSWGEKRSRERGETSIH